MDGEQGGGTPDIVDNPPEPDKPAYPEPSPVAAPVEGGAGDGKTKEKFKDLERRLETCLDAHTALAEAGSEAVARAKTDILDEVTQSVTERLAKFKGVVDADRDRVISGMLGEVVERVEGVLGRAQDYIGEARKDLAGDIARLRTDVGDKASREEVNSLSGAIGSLRGDVASFRESVDGLKSAERARADSVTALNDSVHGLDGTMDTFKGRVKAVEDATDEARRELEALRQTDTGFSAEQTKLTVRVRGIEHALEELKGAFKGIRDEVLPDVRKAAIRAEQAATAASAQVAGLLPRLEYFGDLALEMRNLRSFMDRVEALERWRIRHSADIADVAVRVGLNELAEELRGTLPKR